MSTHQINSCLGQRSLQLKLSHLVKNGIRQNLNIDGVNASQHIVHDIAQFMIRSMGYGESHLKTLHLLNGLNSQMLLECFEVIPIDSICIHIADEASLNALQFCNKAFSLINYGAPNNVAPQLANVCRNLLQDPNSRITNLKMTIDDWQRYSRMSWYKK